MAGIGDFGHPTPRSSAQAVSADGSVVVGRGTGASPYDSRAFRWTEAGGMVALVDPAGELLEAQAFDISADGSVIVGVGSGETAPNQAFRRVR